MNEIITGKNFHQLWTRLRHVFSTKGALDRSIGRMAVPNQMNFWKNSQRAFEPPYFLYFVHLALQCQEPG